MKGYSKYLKSKKKIVAELIAKLHEKYEFVSVLGTDVNGYSISVDRMSSNVAPAFESECGFCIKVYYEGVYSEYSVTDINKNNTEEIIKQINELTTEKHGDNIVKVGILQEEILKKKFKRNPVGKEFTKEEVMDILKSEVEKGLQSSKLVVNIRTRYQHMEISKMYMSTKKDLEQYYTWDNIMAMSMVKRDDNLKYDFSSTGDNNAEALFALLPKYIEKTIGVATELLDAELPKPGVYDVITDPGVTGLIVHEAFGHGVEMDMFVKDRAKSVEYMNKPVASKLVNMHDGAKAIYCVGSYFFDDDGVLAHDTKIINKGTLVSGISDALSALELGTTPTGNGRRESYKRKSYTRMTNTFFEAGKSNLEDMIKSIDYGYMIFESNNGMEDPKNWGIQCTAGYGREIKDGKFTGKVVTPVVMSGYVVDLLSSISAISTGLEINGSGHCGKGYKEWVCVSDGGACLKAKVKIG